MKQVMSRPRPLFTFLYLGVFAVLLLYGLFFLRRAPVWKDDYYPPHQPSSAEQSPQPSSLPLLFAEKWSTEGEEEAALLALRGKVKVIVLTVAKNRGRVELMQQTLKDDPWAKDLFLFLSDEEEEEEKAHTTTITYPQCNTGRWGVAKCCRFDAFYFETWEDKYPEVEWVFKADDDTFVFPRNLLLTIASLNRAANGSASDTTTPLFLGDRASINKRRVREDDPAFGDMASLTIWPNGGAGWLLNRAARDHLKRQPKLDCSELDDVGFGNWATHHGLPITPYFGLHQWTTFDEKKYKEGQDFLGSRPAAVAFFLCVADEVIRLPYYPITFHKLMATFPQMLQVMQRKRFELVEMPPLREEYRGREGRSDNYYHRIRPWLADVAASQTAYEHVDCHSHFQLDSIWHLKNTLHLV